MPRGYPIKNKIIQPELDMTKNLDNTTMNDKSNLNDLAVAAESPVTTKSVEVNNDKEYTISPDGKYKILKPKPNKHAEFLEKSPSRIPYITGPLTKEYEFFWATDREPNSIPAAISQGWEFVDPSSEGCESAKEPVYAGVRPDGSAYFHYAMWMRKEKHAEIQSTRQDAITRKEQEILRKPSAEANSGIYATEQMKLGGAAARTV